MEKYLGNAEQLCFARLVSTSFGEMIYVKCGKLFLSLLCDRCLDVYDLTYAGDNIGYMSAVGLNSYPLNTNFQSRFEGGFLFSSGLDNIGNEAFGKPMHGSMHMKKAEIFRIEKDSDTVFVGGIIDFSTQFGQKLKMKRTYRITEKNIRLTDEFIVPMEKTAEIMQLYHFNFGYPMLCEETKISLPNGNVVGRTLHAQKDIDKLNSFSVPIDDYEEKCYFCTCHQGRNRTIVENEKLGRKVVFEFDGEIFPKLIEWKSERSGDYALGIEPCVTDLDDKAFVCVKNGETHTIEIKIY